jgi:putative toxin-antitoxin system antitoxin component (TIGR02293 family)
MVVNAPEITPIKKLNRSVDAEIAHLFAMNISELFEVLASPQKLAERLNSRRDPFSEKNLAVLRRAVKIWPRAIEVLGDESTARQWLTQTNRSLGGIAPLVLLGDENDCTMVSDTLGRIEYGIVS